MRTQFTANSATTYYLYDDEAGGGVPVAELSYAGTTTSLQYLNGTCADGWRLRYVGGVAYVETYDPQGSIVQSGQDLAAGQTQYARATYCYDGFGALRGRYSSSGSTTNVHQDPAGFGGQYGYYQDLQTGLEHLGARYYDGGTGRFVTRDPIGYGGGENLYAFCGNNPITGSDPEGTSDSSDFGLGELKSFGNFAQEVAVSAGPGGSFTSLLPESFLHPFQAGKHASEAEKDGLTFGGGLAFVGSLLTPAGAERVAEEASVAGPKVVKTSLAGGFKFASRIDPISKEANEALAYFEPATGKIKLILKNIRAEAKITGKSRRWILYNAVYHETYHKAVQPLEDLIYGSGAANDPYAKKGFYRGAQEFFGDTVGLFGGGVRYLGRRFR